jgi:lipoprotein LpqH
VANRQEVPVKNGIATAAAVASAALVIGGTAGCSSDPPKPKAGVLLPGTSQLTIDGEDAPANGTVNCASVESLTTLKTGDDTTGATVMVSTRGKLIVEFVRIRNLNGFSGDYNRGLEGSATAALHGAVYDITGTARGYSPKSIAPTTLPFTIKMAC